MAGSGKSLRRSQRRQNHARAERRQSTLVDAPDIASYLKELREIEKGVVRTSNEAIAIEQLDTTKQHASKSVSMAASFIHCLASIGKYKFESCLLTFNI